MSVPDSAWATTLAQAPAHSLKVPSPLESLCLGLVRGLRGGGGAQKWEGAASHGSSFVLEPGRSVPPEKIKTPTPFGRYALLGFVHELVSVRSLPARAKCGMRGGGPGAGRGAGGNAIKWNECYPRNARPPRPPGPRRAAQPRVSCGEKGGELLRICLSTDASSRASRPSLSLPVCSRARG